MPAKSYNLYVCACVQESWGAAGVTRRGGSQDALHANVPVCGTAAISDGESDLLIRLVSGAPADFMMILIRMDHRES